MAGDRRRVDAGATPRWLIPIRRLIPAARKEALAPTMSRLIAIGLLDRLHKAQPGFYGAPLPLPPRRPCALPPSFAHAVDLSEPQ